MTTAVSIPAAPRRRRTFTFRHVGAQLVAWAGDEKKSLWLALGFTVLHVLLWTAILTQQKAGQDVHFDVAEAYAWGQKFLLGYGKHPPLSGWVAGAWFTVFPAADWATYALAMTTVGVGMMICWLIALRVVDRRRAFLVLVMLAIYPIFNFKGYKYNPDLLQLVTLPLVVLAYLNAFEKRTLLSGILLGLAGALALMTKYWVATMIGAVGLAALLHPQRLQFLRSPAPWAAIVTMALAMVPHFIWLERVNFLPFTYAGDTYEMADRGRNVQLVLGYIGHNFALLALPVVLVAATLGWSTRWWKVLARNPLSLVTRSWSRAPNHDVRYDQALNIWLIQVIVALGPPIGALFFKIYLKTDWGISLFFLAPLAVVAIPALRIRRAAVSRLAGIWLVVSLAVFAAAPKLGAWTIQRDAAGMPDYGSRSQLAHELTDMWHQHFFSRWSVVAAATDLGEPMTFYSADHPAPLTPGEAWPSGLTSLDEAKHDGFIGICEVDDWKQKACDAWMGVNAANAEKIVMTTRRFFDGHAGSATSWNVYLVPPAK